MKTHIQPVIRLLSSIAGLTKNDAARRQALRDGVSEYSTPISVDPEAALDAAVKSSAALLLSVSEGGVFHGSTDAESATLRRHVDAMLNQLRRTNDDSVEAAAEAAVREFAVFQIPDSIALPKSDEAEQRTDHGQVPDELRDLKNFLRYVARYIRNHNPPEPFRSQAEDFGRLIAQERDRCALADTAKRT